MGTEKKKHRRSSEPSSPQRGPPFHISSPPSPAVRCLHKKSGEKHKSKSHKHKDSSKLKFEELTKDDYFSKNNEFAAWLKEKKNLFFMDLSSEAAHDLFLDFVKEWNKGKLASEYYEGISTGPRSSHKWNIKQ
nr:style cell-cycle inhibitor 1-B isoform X1 [Ipomoea batatas]GMC93896.1 style cell-cycle inhibitor 1-B isoform X1 [Ipomoea batatas]GMC95650.1 style cell-cycle inhibitor 1-B isoform X1 [Ipomoea batatas]